MILRTVLFNFAVLSGLFAYGQIEISRQVIGSLGKSEMLYNDVEISITAGEIVVQTVSNDSLTLTQGFQQPGFKGFLNFSIFVTDASCPTSADGSAIITDLVGCIPPYTILWSNGSETNTAEDLAPGLYSVTIETNHCALTKAFEVGVFPGDNCEDEVPPESSFDLRFFNAFSPNDDGINDNWEIENIDNERYDANRVEIFNRWGQRVWDGERYDNTNVVWKGKTSGGNELPSATYFYIATINDVIYKGFIELTR